MANESQENQDAPSFGIAEAVATFDSTMQSTGSLGRTEAERPGAVEDELSNAASVDKVQEVTEQLAEFLVKFSSDEQYAILTPFLSMLDTGDEFVEPHIDEARKFICHYLAVFSQCERDLILEKWRPAFDTASLNSATESLTPSALSQDFAKHAACCSRRRGWLCLRGDTAWFCDTNRCHSSRVSQRTARGERGVPQPFSMWRGREILTSLSMSLTPTELHCQRP
eukprot:s5831_g3.t1